MEFTAKPGKKPVLFLGLDGPVLIPPHNSHDRDEYLGAAVAPYAKAFLHWATQHFDVRWLSDRGVGPAVYVSSLLSLPSDKVHVAGFIDSKVEAIEPHKNFYWVDTDLIPHEISWLAQHGHGEKHLIPVDPMTGVTPDTKQMLEHRIGI
jgi:hypothetical protein